MKIKSLQTQTSETDFSPFIQLPIDIEWGQQWIDIYHKQHQPIYKRFEQPQNLRRESLSEGVRVDWTTLKGYYSTYPDMCTHKALKRISGKYLNSATLVFP